MTSGLLAPLPQGSRLTRLRWRSSPFGPPTDAWELSGSRYSKTCSNALVTACSKKPFALSKEALSVAPLPVLRV
ncbi:hypothetical protein J2W76_002618 [Methylorubrum zatmanii]|nr:hypothetical protein [Methylorubrum zatmanii]MCP1554014.1 hypothetical protein [Methylorubrum extorquens]MCP1579675.1 hypothetical protein [Methylorubrum extorquens]